MSMWEFGSIADILHLGTTTSKTELGNYYLSSVYTMETDI